MINVKFTENTKSIRYFKQIIINKKMVITYEKNLREKAKELKENLRKENINAVLYEDSWEEYCVSMNIKHAGIDIGDVKIYYSPNKKTYKYINLIKDKNFKEIIKNIQNSSNIKNVYTNKGYEIDVDGSYQKGRTAYGAIIRKNGKVIKKLSGEVTEKETDGSRQIAGELRAVEETVNWCKENKINDITIYYDYAGIENWARGRWMAKKNITKKYAMFMNKAGMKINWVKIKSHTGVYWNEEADKLANKAISN
jgi:ribonuclease HI